MIKTISRFIIFVGIVIFQAFVHKFYIVGRILIFRLRFSRQSTLLFQMILSTSLLVLAGFLYHNYRDIGLHYWVNYVRRCSSNISGGFSLRSANLMQEPLVGIWFSSVIRSLSTNGYVCLIFCWNPGFFSNINSYCETIRNSWREKRWHESRMPFCTINQELFEFWM